MVGERAKGWRVRRTLSYEGRTTYQFLAGWTVNGPIWRDDYIDSSIYVDRELAERERNAVREANVNQNAIFHAVVDA
jgi:hypothetical protein